MASNGTALPKVLDAKARDFLNQISRIMIEEVMPAYEDRSSKVVEFKQPEELKELIDMSIGSGPVSTENMISLTKQVIKYSVKTGHPRFLNQLYAGVDPYCLAGSWLSDALNTNAHTFEVAPVFLTMEKLVIERLCHFVGWRHPVGDGLFCPGGSMCNFFAVHLARYRANPKVKLQGHVGHQRMVLFTSQDAHYSLLKASSFLGLGIDNLIVVNVDERGKMDPQDLEKRVVQAKEEGALPFFVNATCGTTVLGAYDPLPAIADVCEKHGLWLHADATWGGACLLTDRHKSLVSGIERCDSVSWNLHKMMGALLQCSALLVKQQGLLEQVNCSSAEYLFQKDKYYDPSYDVGDKSLQCGRKIDALKLWFMWKAQGDDSIAARIDRAYDNARYLEAKLRATEGFRLVLPAFECTNICFWYIPSRMRGQPETEAWWKELGLVAPAIKQGMVECGSMMIGYQPIKRLGHPNCFRFVVSNAVCGHEDMDFVLREIQRLGELA